jgi:hypothetical protein
MSRILIYTVFIFLLLPGKLQSQFSGGIGKGDANSSIPSASISNFWYGTISTAWNVAGNWGNNVVPAAGDDIVFALNAANHLVLNNDKTVGNINFNGSAKKIMLGGYNVTINGDVLGANANSYIQTNATGAVLHTIANQANVTFHVGNSAYNPVKITNKTAADDGFSVRVIDEVYFKGTTGSIATTPRVKRTWLIDKTIPNSYDEDGVNFSFFWNANEVTSGLNSPRLYHYDGTQWEKQTAGATANYTNNLDYIGYKGTFSPFAIGDDVVLLPVVWLDFHCEKLNDGSAYIKWRTSMEYNTRTFTVERSADGQTYQSIGKLNAAGHSQTIRNYVFADSLPLNSGGYYRVRLEDMEGNFSYSDMCNIKTTKDGTHAPLKVFPNPTDGVLHIVALEPERNFVWGVFSASGQCVARGNSKEGQAKAPLHHLSEGVYQLRVVGSGFSESQRILIQH